MNKKSEEVNIKTVFQFGLLLFLDVAGKLMAKITKYFPFSLIGEKIAWHYNNRDIIKAWDIISDSWKGTGTYFHIISNSKDDNFVHFVGEFEPRRTSSKIVSKFKLRIENKVGQGNVFFRDQEDGLYKINFIREALNVEG
jgi:hypothetical protein